MNGGSSGRTAATRHDKGVNTDQGIPPPPLIPDLQIEMRTN